MPTTGSKYKNSAVLDCPILGIAYSCDRNAKQQQADGIKINRYMFITII